MKKIIGDREFIENEKGKKVYNTPLLKKYGNINNATQGGKLQGKNDGQSYFDDLASGG